MVRLRQNNTEAFESHFSAVFESFLLDHFKSSNYISLNKQTSTKLENTALLYSHSKTNMSGREDWV